MNRLSLVLALACSTVFAADEQGFVPLFNGRDLSGWVNANCAPETWSVRDGLIHCTGRPTGALRTTRQYENFILEVEWRHLSSGGNSGVFIWGTPIAAPGVPFLRGIEVQVLDHGFNIPGKNEWYTTHGDVFPIHGASMKPFGRHNGDRSFPSEERSKGSPEWNRYQIVCTNGVLRLSVNGKEVSGGEDCNYRKGYLALESEGAPVEFRNIRIKELPSNQPAANLVAPADQGWRSLFTGLDLRGWQTNAAAQWSAKGEKIAGDPSGGKSTLWTDLEFGNAEFVIDCRMAKGDGNVIPPAVRFGSGENNSIEIPLTGAVAGQYVRHTVTVRGSEVTVAVAGKEPQRLQRPGTTKARFGLAAGSTAVEFMNAYVRDL